MLTEARIREELRPQQLDSISALRAPAIRKLVASGSLQLSLFDDKDLAEVTDPCFPGERLSVGKNPLLAEEGQRKRNELLAATERKLEQIVEATRRERNRLQGKERIALRVGRVLERSKMGKHFDVDIRDNRLSYERKLDNIAEEAALDGICVVRTSLSAATLDAKQTVLAYKGLSNAEHAFRSMKTIDLKVRPIHHWSADRVRAHVFLCMLAYHVERHMRRMLAPILFDDDDAVTAAAQRKSVVASAHMSARARRKAQRKRTEDTTGPPDPCRTTHWDHSWGPPQPRGTPAPAAISTPTIGIRDYRAPNRRSRTARAPPGPGALPHRPVSVPARSLDEARARSSVPLSSTTTASGCTARSAMLR